MKNTIIIILSQELEKIFQQYFSKTNTDENKLWLEVLLTLNKLFFRERLLFRDYLLPDEQLWQTFVIKDKKIQIHIEANFYLLEVLNRKLTLANSLKSEPTNMHKLLISYCQRSQDKNWQQSRIERGFYKENIENTIFQNFANKLKQQCQQLGENYSTISQSRRNEFGPYWFINQGTYIEVAEELSLFQVLTVIPLWQETNNDPPLLLSKVIESLNEKYALLRSCGLPPRFWYARDIPIWQLKELKQLRAQVKLLINSGVQKISAYEQAFNTLKATTKTWGGFSCFNLFLHSLIGKTMIGITVDFIDPEDEQTPNLDKQLFNLPDQYPDDFNPVTKYVFIALICERIKVYSQGKEGLINDPQFLSLIKENPDYASLSKKALIKTLQQQLVSIINKYIGE